mgnify:CR=1 FL=1
MGQHHSDVQESAGQGEDLTGTSAFSEDELRAGSELFSIPAQFLLSVADIGGLPPADRTEIAFAGRSNVGKSSLLNALTRRRSLARTSNTPGRTQTLNYYSQGQRLYLVDMPGYGYARASKTAIRQWTALIFEYLRGRATLARVFMLIDARHGIKQSDTEVMRQLDEAAVSYQVVFTKSDKISGDELAKLAARTADALRRHGAAHPHILATSARQRSGLAELSASIAALVAQ